MSACNYPHTPTHSYSCVKPSHSTLTHPLTQTHTLKPINIMLGRDWRQDRTLAQKWWDTFERLQLILRRAAAAGLAPEVSVFFPHFFPGTHHGTDSYPQYCPELSYLQYVACLPYRVSSGATSTPAVSPKRRLYGVSWTKRTSFGRYAASGCGESCRACWTTHRTAVLASMSTLTGRPRSWTRTRVGCASSWWSRPCARPSRLKTCGASACRGARVALTSACAPTPRFAALSGACCRFSF